jgi:glycosyltransferase involved in cell wall biosynthesis
MLTVIIPTRESERTLVQTLSPLVAGATAGLIAEVIVADAGSRDATEEVAEIAGCRFLQSEAPLGARLAQAAALARSPWLLFLRPGIVPEVGWVEAVEDFIRSGGQAASFRRPSRSVWDFFGPRVRPEQGLLISARAYAQAGGHRASDDTEAVLLRKVRPALLAATLRAPVKVI